MKSGSTTTRRKPAVLLASCALLGLGPALALALAEVVPELRLSGFGNLGFTRTTDEDLGFRLPNQPAGDGGKWQYDVDSVLGLQVDARWNERLSAMAQVVAMRGNEDRLQPLLQWAFVSFRPTPDWDLRIGRVLTPVFMDSENRLVHYSLIPARSASHITPFYPLSSHDGFSLERRLRLDSGELRLTGYAGQTHIDAPLDTQGRSQRFYTKLLYGFAVAWEAGDVSYRIAYTDLQKAGIAGGVADAFRALPALLRGMPAELCAVCAGEALKYERSAAGKASMQILDAGVQAQLGEWNVVVEAFVRRGSGTLPKLHGQEIMISREFGDFTPYLKLGRTRADGNVTPVFPAGLHPALDALNLRSRQGDTGSRSVALGVRWDLRQRVAIKAEVERFRLDSALGNGPQFQTSPPGGEHVRNVGLLTLSASFVF